ncbi:hypothetical protein [Methylocaldum sp.]|uniref:hypothetical protein n=1 Tax=Methylocaldum sp. TaxID=1969727 RepID=UPI002D4E8CA4|nr:hypothetical protein [Methylocaldum sp.]HYE36398.1 hypothetical protein [Methylocaldum sp.]
MEHPNRLSKIPELAARWRSRDLSDAAYAALYFFIWQIATHGQRFASRKSKNDPRPNASSWVADFDRSVGRELELLLIDRVERYHFLGVIPNVSVALSAWLRGEWPLLLIERIPTPEEVLLMQAAGRRPITVVADYPRLLRPVLKKPNGFAFFVHDLEHAFKFFHDWDLHEGQRKFFGLILQAVRQDLFDPYLGDEVFAEKFDYLISDMNTHVIHSLRFLGAILIECFLRREEKTPRETLSRAAEDEIAALLHALSSCWEFPPAAEKALLRLVNGAFGESDAALIEETVLLAG